MRSRVGGGALHGQQTVRRIDHHADPLRDGESELGADLTDIDAAIILRRLRHGHEHECRRERQSAVTGIRRRPGLE